MLIVGIGAQWLSRDQNFEYNLHYTWTRQLVLSKAIKAGKPGAIITGINAFTKTVKRV